MKPVKLRLEIISPFSLPLNTLYEKFVLLEMISNVSFFFYKLNIMYVSHLTVVPPFGQEDVEDLQSIFEVIHLKKHVLFLDTQCELDIYIFILIL